MELKWEIINNISTGSKYYRTPVPNGWLVEAREYGSIAITFVPDKEHTWVI
jgi:hypothetical protein